MRDGAQVARDFAPGQLLAGPASDPGPAGEDGAPGDPGPAGPPVFIDLVPMTQREQTVEIDCPRGNTVLGGPTRSTRTSTGPASCWEKALAFVALLVALGGVSYAAVGLPAGSVGTPQLRAGAVPPEKLGSGAVTASYGGR